MIIIYYFYRAMLYAEARYVMPWQNVCVSGRNNGNQLGALKAIVLLFIGSFMVTLFNSVYRIFFAVYI